MKYVVDLPGVALSMLRWLRGAARGRGLRNKALLLSLLPLHLFPRAIRRRYPATSAIRTKLMRTILSKAVITYRGCAFRPPMVLSVAFAPFSLIFAVIYGF